MNEAKRVPNEYKLINDNKAIQVTVSINDTDEIVFIVPPSLYEILKEARAVCLHVHIAEGTFETMIDLSGLTIMGSTGKAGESEDKNEYYHVYKTDEQNNVFFYNQTDNKKQWGNEQDKVSMQLVGLKRISTTPEERYDCIIKKADEAFKKGDYETAENLYKEAKQLQPLEEYPIEQLKKIENLKHIAHALIKMGELYQAGKYEECMALSDNVVKNSDSTPEQIEKAKYWKDKCLVDIDWQKKDRKYTDLLSEADRLFEEGEEDKKSKNGKWKEAKEKYKEALVLKAEPHPKERIKIIGEYFAQSNKRKAILLGKVVAGFVALLLVSVSGWYVLQPSDPWQAIIKQGKFRIGIDNTTPVQTDSFPQKLTKLIIAQAHQNTFKTVITTESGTFDELNQKMEAGDLDIIFYAGGAVHSSMKLYASDTSYWDFEKVIAYSTECPNNMEPIGIHENDKDKNHLSENWKKIKEYKDLEILDDLKNGTIKGIICDLPMFLKIKEKEVALQCKAISLNRKPHYNLISKNISLLQKLSAALGKVKQTADYKKLIKHIQTN